MLVSAWGGSARGIAAAVVAMARGLRVRSVAEGVEDAATLRLLGTLGCDEVQGYYIAPPMAAREFEAWLTAGGATDLARLQVDELIGDLERARCAASA